MNDFFNENQPNNEEEIINEPSRAEPQETVANEPQETVTEEPPQTATEEPQQTVTGVNPDLNDLPPVGNLQYNPVIFTEIIPETDKKSSAKGLKVFALILVCIIALTATGLVGYFSGKNTSSSIGNSNHSKIELQNTPEDKNAMTPSAVYEKVNPSVVGIMVYNAAGKGSQASGIVYSKDGYIITNDHIYSEVSSPKFKIYTSDGKEYDAKYVAGDTVSDLAVLKIDDCKLTPAVFGNSDELYEGQNVVAIGRPNDATDASSITSGIISATNRRVSNTSSYPARLIQTDSSINPGSSGGALVNMYGQVVGVTNAKLAGVDVEGVGYAIPTTVMQRIAGELISEGKVVSRAKLGVTYLAVDSVTAEINSIKHTGLLIESVSNDSDLYGKVDKGDIITHINGTEITTDDMVLDIIEKCKAGDKITVSVITDDGASLTLNVELKANVGESSYTIKDVTPNGSDNSQPSGGTFDFPFGE